MKLYKNCRRTPWLFFLVGMIFFVMIATPCLAQKVELTMFIWPGSNQDVVPKEVINEYMKSHPDVKIRLYESSNAVTYPKMVAAKKTTPDKPLVHFGFFNISASSSGDIDDMWESLDPKGIPNMVLTEKSLWRKDNKGITYGGFPIGLMYNKDKVKVPPTSWADLWHPRFKGKVAMWDYTWFAQIMAARLNGGNEKNMDPGFKLWAENAKQIHSLITSNDQMKNLIVSGDAWIAPWYSFLFRNWEKEGAPLGYANPKEGMIFFPIFLQIVKGCTPDQKKVAEEIINIMLTPEKNGRYNELTVGIPTVTNAVVSKDIHEDPLFSPGVLKTLIHLDWKTIAEQTSEWKERWDKEVKPKL
jgi:putative spermidine/putrescine transport system substrate-binding protein